MCRRGFTLIEVLVALTLSAVVVLLGHRVFTAVVDGSVRVRATQEALDRGANARRWLTEAFGSLAVGTPAGGGFEGTPSRVEFETWLPTVARGFVPRRVGLAVDDGRLVAAIEGQEPLGLRDSVASAAFDYLLEGGANARWVGEWRSPVSAPLAVRLRLAGRAPASGEALRVDTLLLLIGPRG